MFKVSLWIGILEESMETVGDEGSICVLATIFFPKKSNSMMLVVKLLTSAYKTKSVISTIARPQ